jgi:hypothetical protein
MNIELVSPIQGICKSWGLWERNKDNSISPILYFHKPKNISQERYEKIIKSLQIYIKDM